MEDSPKKPNEEQTQNTQENKEDPEAKFKQKDIDVKSFCCIPTLKNKYI